MNKLDMVGEGEASASSPARGNPKIISTTTKQRRENLHEKVHQR